jgi:hypothetical protein
MPFKVVGAPFSSVSRSGRVRSVAPSFDGKLGLRVARSLATCSPRPGWLSAQASSASGSAVAALSAALMSPTQAVV